MERYKRGYIINVCLDLQSLPIVIIRIPIRYSGVKGLYFVGSIKK